MQNNPVLITICILFTIYPFTGEGQCWLEQRKVYPYNQVNRILYDESDSTSLLSVIHKFANDTAQNTGAIKGIDHELHYALDKLGEINLREHPDFRYIQIDSVYPLIDYYGIEVSKNIELFIYPDLNIEYLANKECDIEITEYYDFTDSTWKIEEITFYYFFGFKLQKQPTMQINWKKLTDYCEKEGITANWFEKNNLVSDIVFKVPCDLYCSNTISALTVKKVPYLSIRSTFIEADKVRHLFEGGDDLIYTIYDFVSNDEILLYLEPHLSEGIYVEHYHNGFYASNPVLKNKLHHYFGYLDYESNIPLTNAYGEDSISINGEIVYPSIDTVFFKEKHIEQFRVTELGMYNPETKVITYKPVSWSIICKNENEKYGTPYWINFNSFFNKLIDEHPSLDSWKAIVQKTIEEGEVYQLWEIKDR